jgi:hypothetical protein
MVYISGSERLTAFYVPSRCVFLMDIFVKANLRPGKPFDGASLFFDHRGRFWFDPTPNVPFLL